MKTLLYVLMVSMISNAYAMIDYGNDSDPSGNSPASMNVTAKKFSNMSNPNNARKPKSSSSSGNSNLFELSSQYDSQAIQTRNKQGKLERILANLNLDTPFNVGVNISYWQGRDSGRMLGENGSFQSGNVSFQTNLKWFQVGEGMDATRIDLIGGMMLKQSSTIASGRSDTWIGLETSKRFYDLALAFGAVQRFTGQPARDEETRIGDITKISAALGWAASNDIRFLFSFDHHKIAEADRDDNGQYNSSIRYLKEKLNISTLTPKLILLLINNTELELFATIPGKRVGPEQREDLLYARVFDIPGIYGSTLGTALKLNF